MNTPAHLIFGLTAFGRPGRPGVTGAALAGGLIPDLSLYILAGTHLLVLGTEPRVVFGELYFSQAWQSIFRVDNSFILWGIGLALALMAKAPWAIALTGAALLHLTLDFGFHHDDGRAHFWPVTNWIFQSPFSYWDNRHFGGIVGPAEVIAALICAVFLWRRFKGWGMRGLIVLLALAEAVPGIVFGIMFA
jgi:hypothetical protein